MAHPMTKNPLGVSVSFRSKEHKKRQMIGFPEIKSNENVVTIVDSNFNSFSVEISKEEDFNDLKLYNEGSNVELSEEAINSLEELTA